MVPQVTILWGKQKYDFKCISINSSGVQMMPVTILLFGFRLNLTLYLTQSSGKWDIAQIYTSDIGNSLLFVLKANVYNQRIITPFTSYLLKSFEPVIFLISSVSTKISDYQKNRTILFHTQMLNKKIPYLLF